jgi:hypothetical protein
MIDRTFFSWQSEPVAGQSLTGLKILALGILPSSLCFKSTMNWSHFDQTPRVEVASVEAMLDRLQSSTSWRKINFSEDELIKGLHISCTARQMGSWLRWGRLILCLNTVQNAFSMLACFSNSGLRSHPVSVLKVIFLALRWQSLKDLRSLLISKQIDFILLGERLEGVRRLMMRVAALHAGIPVIQPAHPGLYTRPDSKFLAGVMRSSLLRRRGKIKSISEIYGAREIISRYCCVPADQVRFRAYWMHGWLPAFQNVHPAFIALHKTSKYSFGMRWRRDSFDTRHPQWVCRQDQAIFLRQHGYTEVHTVGHPLAYMRLEPSQRIAGSLLVVPPHGGGCRGESDILVLNYVEYIQSIRQNFSDVVLCVTVADYLAGDWWPSFERIGIETVVSVERSNPLALYRMMGLLSQFEYVTTNGFGSVIAYAAAAGCRVSVSGPFAELPEVLLRKAHTVIHHPELLQPQIDICSEAMMRRHYPELFCAPQASDLRKAWAEQELGFSYRRSPEWMRAALIDHRLPEIQSDRLL